MPFKLNCYLSLSHSTKFLSTYYGVDTGLDPGNKINT